MIFNIILGVIIIGSIVGIVILITRKFSHLNRIDTSVIPGEKTKDVKSALMEQRLERKFQSLGKFFEQAIKPVLARLSQWLKRLREKVVVRAKHYRERTKAKNLPSLEEKEETRQKVNRLLTEAIDFEKSGDLHNAEAKYLEVLSLDMKNIEAYEHLGWIYYQNKDYVHAKETFEFIKKINAKEDEIYLCLGEVCWALGQKEESLLNYKEAVRLNPNDPRNLDLLYHAAIKLNDKYLATTTLDKLKQVNPENQKLAELEQELMSLNKN